MIRVQLLGPFGRFMKEEDEHGYWNMDMAGKTIEEVIRMTQVSSSKMNYSAFVNNVAREKNYVLEEGDELSVLPLFFAG